LIVLIWIINNRIIPRASQKTVAIIFPADSDLRFLRSWWSPLFWLFLRLECEWIHVSFTIMNRRRNLSHWNMMLKHLQTLFWNRHTVALMVHSERTRPTLLFHHPIVRAKLKSLWYACGLNKLAHFHSSINQNNIVNFINDFWRSSLNSDVPNEMYHMWMYDHV